MVFVQFPVRQVYDAVQIVGNVRCSRLEEAAQELKHRGCFDSIGLSMTSNVQGWHAEPYGYYR